MSTRLIVAICMLCLAGCSVTRGVAPPSASLGQAGSPGEGQILLASTATAEHVLLVDRLAGEEASSTASTPQAPADDARDTGGQGAVADDGKGTLTAVGVVLILLSVISLIAVGATL